MDYTCRFFVVEKCMLFYFLLFSHMIKLYSVRQLMTIIKRFFTGLKLHQDRSRLSMQVVRLRPVQCLGGGVVGIAVPALGALLPSRYVKSGPRSIINTITSCYSSLTPSILSAASSLSPWSVPLLSMSKLGSAQWNEEHGVNPNDKGQRTEAQLLKDLLTHPDSAVLAHKICLLRMF